MVGAITTLIIIVAVFLAYNANSGLPFVPTYRVSAEVPNAARLVRNNEVRIGGHRVGVVESIEPIQNDENGSTAAKLNLKLDKAAQPLPTDTTVRVRYRSAFGLKYLELDRGDGPPLPEGGTLPIKQAIEQTEFDDIANTFDIKTRENTRTNLQGFGTGFASRGGSLNEAIQSLNPLFRGLKPISQILIDPTTRFERLFPELADAARIVAPIATEQSDLFTNMAITFAAISADTRALQDTITSGVPTLEVGTRALRNQKPFLAELAEFSADLRPGIRQLRIALPDLNEAIRVGTPVLKRTPQFNQDFEDVLVELRQLVEQPQTKLTLTRLSDTFKNARPAAEHIAPYETICNYWNYWFTFLPEHLTETDQIGTSQRVYGESVPPGLEAHGPLGGYSGIAANGRHGPIPPGNDQNFQPLEWPILHGNPYGPAVTNGQPDCQSGQTGYALGAGGLSVPNQLAKDPAVGAYNLPGLRGVTNLRIKRDGTKTFGGSWPQYP
jgi:virulence factor Mce-like protein